MRIALATCTKLPDWEVDDRPLHEALRARGVEIATPAWTDRSFDWSRCDACLIRTTWDYVPQREAFLGWSRMVDAYSRLFNPHAIVEWNTHKGYLRDLELRGIPVIPTIWLKAGRDQAEWREGLEVAGWKRGFFKPVVGAAAHDTIRFDVTSDGLRAAERHLASLAPGRPMMLQPYLSRVETEGEYSVILIDGEPTHAVRKYPIPGDYRVQDDHGGKDEPATLDADTMALAKRIVQVAGDWNRDASGARDEKPLLYARVDLLRDDAGELRLTELEVVEPSLFFRHGPNAAGQLADALLARLRT